jgi:O-antigen/teichoic acid export membrane protein
MSIENIEQVSSQNLEFVKGYNMSLVTLVITLIVVGVLLWLANTYIPMDGKIKKIINIVVTIAVVFWLLQVFGVWGSIENINVK